MEHKFCPFCGGVPEIVTEKMSEEIRKNRFLDTTIKYIRCTKCKARSGRYKIKEEYWADECSVKYFKITEEKIWKAWDTRC